MQANPGWLLIFANLDTEEAAIAIEELLARFSTWLSNSSAAVQTIVVDEWAPEEATAFLLERTAERRRQADDDATTAVAIAVDDLGSLALGLEQAEAFSLF